MLGLDKNYTEFSFSDFYFLGQDPTRRRSSVIRDQMFALSGLEFGLKGKAWIRLA